MAVDITKHNLKEMLPTIQDALDRCTFFALDCEMTGEGKRQQRQRRTAGCYCNVKQQYLKCLLFIDVSGLFTDGSKHEYLDDIQAR
jgi:hypothetical protein